MIEFIDVYKENEKDGVFIRKLDFFIESGEITVLAGQANSGKSSIINMIFGIERADSGDIFILEKNIKHIKQKELYKAFGYIDSENDLFIHMTVLQNIAIPLYMMNMEKDDIEDRVDIVLSMLGMPSEDYARKYPNELSDYETQKVRIARAISSDPYILVMDDPFYACENDVEESLVHDILRIKEMLDMTILFTTRKISTALNIGQKIAIIRNGRIQQFDSPDAILKTPKNEYVEYFVGKQRLIKKAEMFIAKDVMSKRVATVHEGQNFCQAMQVMKGQNENILVVVDVDDNNIAKPIGIISPKQLGRAFKHNLLIGDVMRRDIKTIDENASLIEVLDYREKVKHFNLPVVDKNKALKGIITERSLLNVDTDYSPDIEVMR